MSSKSLFGNPCKEQVFFSFFLNKNFCCFGNVNDCGCPALVGFSVQDSKAGKANLLFSFGRCFPAALCMFHFLRSTVLVSTSPVLPTTPPLPLNSCLLTRSRFPGKNGGLGTSHRHGGSRSSLNNGEYQGLWRKTRNKITKRSCCSFILLLFIVVAAAL